MLKLTYSNLQFQIFRGRTPDPLFKGMGGKGKEGRRLWGKGREGGRGRIRNGGEGREGTGEGRREGGRNGGGWGGEGGALDMGSAPRDKLWIRP